MLARWKEKEQRVKDGKGGGKSAATCKRAIIGQEDMQRTGHQASDSGRSQGKI